MRKPQVENKYNIKPKDIEKWIIADKERITKPPFWRNNIIGAWCLSEEIQRPFDDNIGYWIGFYDKDAKSYVGKIRLDCYCYGGMVSYNFNTFFNHKNIHCEDDLLIQERLLARLNWLLDEGIMRRE